MRRVLARGGFLFGWIGMEFNISYGLECESYVRSSVCICSLDGVEIYIVSL